MTPTKDGERDVVEPLGWVVVREGERYAPEHLPYKIVSPVLTLHAAQRELLRLDSLEPGLTRYTVEPVGHTEITRLRAQRDRLREALEKIEGYMRSDPDTTSTRFVLHVARAALADTEEE